MNKVSNVIIGNEAFVLLNDEITLSNSQLITAEIYSLKERGLHVTLKINSTGGSVLAGWNIIDALIETESDTHIIGIAASMAGVIAQFGKRRIANDNAIGMIHPPAGGHSEVLEMVRESLKKALLAKSKLTESGIDEYLEAGGKDNFFDAIEMKRLGLIDEVIVTNQPNILVDNNSTSELFQIFNKQITNNDMDLEIKNELKASQNENGKLTNKLELMEGEKEILTNSLKEQSEKVTSLSSENEELKNKIAESEKANAEIYVANKIEQGIFKKEDTEKWVTRVTENMESVEDMIKDIATVDFVIENQLKDEEQKPFNKMNTEEKAELARANPELYNKLIMA